MKMHPKALNSVSIPCKIIQENLFPTTVTKRINSPDRNENIYKNESIKLKNSSFLSES
jgi:hypothetical protein